MAGKKFSLIEVILSVICIVFTIEAAAPASAMGNMQFFWWIFLIIAFLIYQLLGFVNRTRAGQLAKGALIVMAVYLVANILNMRTVTWLLNSLLQVGLLTLVVLFQPEIRRALERMGQTDQWAYRFFNKNRYNDTSLKGAWRSAIMRRGRALFGDQDRRAHRAGTEHQPF